MSGIDREAMQAARNAIDKALRERDYYSSYDGLPDAIEAHLDVIERSAALTPAASETVKWSQDGDLPLPEDDLIDAVHPMRGGSTKLFDEAVRLVSAKRSKYALVGLVAWLLSRARTDADRRDEG